MSHFIESIDLFSKDWNTEFNGGFKHSSAGCQFTNVVATDRVWTSEEETVVDWEISDRVSYVCLYHSSDWRRCASLLWFSELQEPSGCNIHSIEEWSLGSDAKALVNLQKHIQVDYKIYSIRIRDEDACMSSKRCASVKFLGIHVHVITDVLCESMCSPHLQHPHQNNRNIP